MNNTLFLIIGQATTTTTSSPVAESILGNVYGILFWVILGTVMGFLARAILPGEQKMGLISTILLGAVGAALGGFIAMKIGIDVSNIFSVASILSATVGALIVLVIWCLVFKKNWR
jgi:uncharacterized membrane protein YeaQ/YmgE (transglycosylase-associated protein family)